MKKVFLWVVALGLFFCTSVIYVSAAGTYSRPCSNCSGTGQVTRTKQVFGTCSDCAGRLYVRDESASRICFTCGSRNCVFVPGGDYGGFIGSAHYLCGNCGSDEIYRGYACTTCDGEGVCYNTVITKETCTVCDGSGSVVYYCYNHSYGSAEKIDSSTHSRTCSICGYIERTYHTWNSSTVTKQPSCKESGSKTYTCTTCGAEKTETLPKTDTHSYGAWSEVDDDYHTRTCFVCQASVQTFFHTWDSGEIIKQATCKEAGEKSVTCTACNATKTEVIAKLSTHTYDHGCDTDCNVCGATRAITHRYGDWRKNTQEHWKECSVCKCKKSAATHIPGAEPTETTAQTCTACGYVIKPALAHTHSYTYWSIDKHSHYHLCTGCGEKLDVAAHVPGADATANTAQTCTVCGYEIAPALGQSVTEPTTETDRLVCDNPNDAADVGVLWWILAGIAAVGAIVIVIIIYKKKH